MCVLALFCAAAQAPADAATDVWSFGLVLHELFTRQRPFSDIVDVARQPAILNFRMASFYEDLPPGQSPLDLHLLPADDVLPELTQTVAKILKRCLARGQQSHAAPKLNQGQSPALEGAPSVQTDAVDAVAAPKRPSFGDLVSALTVLTSKYKSAHRAASRASKATTTNAKAEPATSLGDS